ncbi:MAG TPA: branched-chain amino acid ABC transporter substrate-binding protein [Gaiellaceae bacterium]|nr:branched-chain amino acid ABC transporter substrate-binding protein [Gaiellaceae bacterium]
MIAIRGFVFLGLAVLLSLVVVGAGSSSPRPLLVAVEGPQSGAQASNGQDQLRGVRLAVSRLNAHGGLWNGRKVALFAADDKGEAGHAKTVARRVIGKGIHFVIGPYNSSVGLANLSLYRRQRVLPLWMTSEDKTAGIGATVQPMNSQIAPIEARYVEQLHARRVAMLVDDTANGAFTKGMATRLRAKLQQAGAAVDWISVKETTAPGLSSTYYADEVSQALASNPDLVYVSTYFPEGVRIAQALAQTASKPPCLMGLANVDNGFVAKTTLAEAQRCVFSGVPSATEMPSAKSYVKEYRAAFGKKPSVWGSFTYDSARILFRAIDRAKSLDFAKVERALRRTKGFRGATGAITIDPKTGYRRVVPVSILRVSNQKRFVVAK